MKTTCENGHDFEYQESDIKSHFVMCGDSANTEHIARLMNGEKADMVFTDPPYGIDVYTDYGDNWKHDNDSRVSHNYSKVIGDDVQFDPSFILEVFSYCDEIFLWGANYYMATNGGSWICWLRAVTEEMEKQPGTHFELCWSKSNHQNLVARIAWKGAAGHNKHEDGDNRMHPTQKPVKLAVWFFDRWGKDKQLIVDLFGGSGSTGIACEQTGRTAYLMELDNKYVDVIRKRWAKYVYPDRWEKEWEQLTPALRTDV